MRLAATAVSAVMLVATGVIVPLGVAAAPNITGCEPGTFYNVSTNYGARFDGIGQVYEDPNYGNTTSISDTSVTTTGTAEITFDVGGSVTIGGSAGVNLGIVEVGANASAEVSLHVSAAVSIALSGTHGIQVPVPPGEYAITQWGSTRVYTYGYYETVLSNCTVTFGKWMYTMVPTVLLGLAHGAFTSPKVPWITNNQW